VVGRSIVPCDLNIVAGGNQRELARQKNQKKQQEQDKKKGSSDKDSNKGMSLEQRKQRHVSVQIRVVQSRSELLDRDLYPVHHS
jgi:hypothetical protein